MSVGVRLRAAWTKLLTARLRAKSGSAFAVSLAGLAVCEARLKRFVIAGLECCLEVEVLVVGWSGKRVVGGVAKSKHKY
jgi:hypothetical protein